MPQRAPGDSDGQFCDKPVPLYELEDLLARAFPIVKAWFQVPDGVTLDLSHVDAVERELFEPRMVAALTLRKIQALRMLSRPGVETALPAVLSLISDVRSALEGMMEQPSADPPAEAELQVLETLYDRLEVAARSLGQVVKDVPISVRIWLR